MKNSALLTVIMVAGMLASCNHDLLPTYEDVDRIYFEFATFNPTELANRRIDSNHPDRVQIRFGYDKVTKQDSIIAISVKVMGHVASFERKVNAGLIEGESTAVIGDDFEILPSVIPANSIVGTLNIRVKNTEKIQNEIIFAKLRLLPNEYFHVDYTHTTISEYQSHINYLSATEYSVYFDAKRDVPGLYVDVTTKSRMVTYFGEYSRKKIEVLCLACGFKEEYFDYDPELYATPLECMNARFPSTPSGMASYWLMANHYVLNWEKENGQYLLDENGVRLYDTFSATMKSYL